MSLARSFLFVFAFTFAFAFAFLFLFTFLFLIAFLFGIGDNFSAVSLFRRELILSVLSFVGDSLAELSFVGLVLPAVFRVVCPSTRRSWAKNGVLGMFLPVVVQRPFAVAQRRAVIHPFGETLICLVRRGVEVNLVLQP